MASVQQSLELVPAEPFFARPVLHFRRVVTRTALIAGVLGAWEVLPRLHLVDATFLPPFSAVLAAAFELWRSGQLQQHIAASLGRSAAGFLLSIVYAVPLGLALGWSKRLADVVSPLLELLRNTAALALLPVFILFLGIGEASKIALVVYAASWPILLNTITGVKGVDPLLVKSARSLGASPFTLFYKVILPAAVPTIFVGIRLAGAYSLVVLVAAEMIGAKAGLGYLVIYSQYNFQIPQMYAGILTLMLAGILYNQLLLALERRFTSWKPGSGA